MKQKNLHSKLSAAIHRPILIVFIIAMTVSCQKLERTSHEINMGPEDGFNAATAKEWYYGVFKKSPAWSNSQLHGKKLPDWKNSIYKRIGNIEIVEFPLLAGKKEILIPSTENLSPTNKKRVADVALTKISFIKKANGQTAVRELVYIPSFQYMQNQNYDISETSMLGSLNDFTGQIVIRNWEGKVLSIKLVKDGKIFRSLRLNKNNKSQIIDGQIVAKTGAYCDGANDLWQCVVNIICDVTIYSDGVEEWGNCREEMTDECWPVYCEEDVSPCEGLTSEECACQLYGVGCDNEEGDGQCDQNKLNEASQDFDNYTNIAAISPIEESGSTTNPGNDPITGSFSWTVIKASIAGWEIRSNCDFKYWHTIWMTTDYHIEHNYDLFDFKSGNGFYVGSNNFITSTYTTTTPTTNQVFNNNTPNTLGISHVRGVIKHVSNLAIRFPKCDPITLTKEDPVDNELHFRPQ
ncbi:MAG: hypothetical protein EOO46_10380 [Flavobacterium sp.]|nr:MAG: hypothetical protein EOO46_10380 [Flavobacterium sp.]